MKKIENIIWFDKSAEADIRKALNLDPEGAALAYVKGPNGEVQEVKKVIDLLDLTISDID